VAVSDHKETSWVPSKQMAALWSDRSRCIICFERYESDCRTFLDPSTWNVDVEGHDDGVCGWVLCRKVPPVRQL
jgi:hypothetical protein